MWVDLSLIIFALSIKDYWKQFSYSSSQVFVRLTHFWPIGCGKWMPSWWSFICWTCSSVLLTSLTSGILYSISCLTCSVLSILYSRSSIQHSVYFVFHCQFCNLCSLFLFSVLWGIRMIPDQFDGSDHILPITKNMYFTIIGIITQFWRSSASLNFWRWFSAKLELKITQKMPCSSTSTTLPQKTKLLLAKRKEERELNK